MATIREQIAALKTAPELPAGTGLRQLVDDARAAAPQLLPDHTGRQAGEAYMQVGSLLHGLMLDIGKQHPTLAFERRFRLALNLLGIAGMELYEARP